MARDFKISKPRASRNVLGKNRSRKQVSQGPILKSLNHYKSAIFSPQTEGIRHHHPFTLNDLIRESFKDRYKKEHLDRIFERKRSRDRPQLLDRIKANLVQTLEPKNTRSLK